MTKEYTSIKFKDWDFKVDKDATMNAYTSTKVGSAEDSQTLTGLNFLKQRDQIFPDEIKDLFTSLGINYKKEAEVSHHEALSDGQHLYSGWFHFKGEFTGPNYLDKQNEESKDFNLISIGKNFAIGFRKENFLTFFEDRNNLVQVEFECIIPWILEEEFEDADNFDL
jgi:hypothetical protein